ncbi:MAG TPA: class I SAM-dependent methyltransferase [Virgibacillus sp.]|nr:class I SAM-dependent methyltransferase [Virgibacillus sp.]
MAYKQMAYVYDQLMKEAPYDQWLDFTKEAFQQSGNQIKKVADLGCGTGEITTLLAKEGYDMIGIDYSSDMLTYAEQKASAKKLSVQWLHQDLRDLDGLANLDAAISFCDVINYITSEEELAAVFKRVADSLKPGGLFLFDIHSLYHVEQNLTNETFADVTDDISYVWFCSEGEESGEMYHDLTFFTLEGTTYLRFDECHHQRTYIIEVYEQLLREAGFKNPDVYYDFSLKKQNNKEKAERVFFVAERRSR